MQLLSLIPILILLLYFLILIDLAIYWFTAKLKESYDNLIMNFLDRSILKYNLNNYL